MPRFTGDFAFLWRHRERPASWARFIRVWAKRIVLFYALSLLIWRAALVRAKGASVGRLVVVGRAQISGRMSHLAIGEQTSLGRCTISVHDEVKIGRHVAINDGVSVLTASHSLRDPDWRTVTGPIEIGDYAWIATNAVILPGVRIGHGAVVGAGAVVREDVPPYGVVTGNPATLRGTKRTSPLRYSPVYLCAPFEAWLGRAEPAGE